MTRTRARKAVTLGVATMLLGALVAMPVVVGAQEPADFRTQVEGLGGYSAIGQGAPVSVQFFDVTGGTLPTDPGEPEFEGTENYSRAVLGTGPQSRATASSAWPGPAFGDGFATICGCERNYFLKVDARYPEGPKFEEEQAAPGSSSGMLAQAFALDVRALATGGESPNPDGAGFGSSSSESTSTVNEENVVVATADASVKDVSIGGGLITIDSVRTVLRATSDGETAATEGTTTVSGFAFMGTPFRFSNEGLVVGGQGLVPPPGGPPTPDDFNITVELVEHQEDVNGASGERFAGGLIITIPSQSLASAMFRFEEESGQNLPVNPLSPPQTGLNDELDSGIAQAYVSALFPFLTSAPTIRYVFGRAKVEAAASQPFVLPDFPTPSFEAPPPTTTSPPSGGTFDPPSFSTPVDTSVPTTEQPSQVAPPATGGPVLAAAPELPDWFDGLPFVLFLLGAMITGIGGYGLRGLSGAALGSGSSEFCDSGAPKRVPDLRTG